MTPSRFKTIISGALKSWRLDMGLTYEMDGFSCLISDKSGLCVKIVFEEQAFGNIWRISKTGDKERVHPSIGAALKSLSLLVCPDRSVGRVIFAK